MDDKELRLESHFSQSRGLFPWVVAGLALAGIVLIILTLTTGIAESLLPMDESYLAILVPAAKDGAEALSLQALKQTSDEKALSVEGVVMNRTETEILGLRAVIQVNDRFTLPAQTVEIPVVPEALAASAAGTFQTAIPLGEHGLGGYTLRFRLPDEGPFVPHRDDRPVPPQQIAK